MLGLSFGIAALLLSTAIPLAIGQTASTYDAQDVFTNDAAQLYTRSDSLAALSATLYDLSVPSNYSSPDLLLTLNSTTNGTGLGLYCSQRGVQPGPGNALWTSDLSTTVNQIFISKNDIYYSQILQRITTTPALTCAVINGDQNTTDNYTFSMSVISDNLTLVASEQVLLANLYSRCCGVSGSCQAWKALSAAQSSNANLGQIMTDFCSFPGQICSPTANLWRMDLSGFNMTCDLPADLFTQFTQLSTLILAGNNYTGNTTAVGQTLGGLQDIQFFDGTGNTALTGTYDSGEAQTGLCSAAQRSLVSLTMTSMNASGSIPSCLYSSGSKVLLLSLDSNNFSGSIQDIIPSNSSLQGLDVSSNQLTGSIPSSIGNAQLLVTLDLSNNKLTGSLPSSLGSIAPLVSFTAVSNKLQGAIPDSIGVHNNLEVFDVKDNQITAFPSAWSSSSYNATNSSWVNIRASFNSLKGGFPVGLAAAPSLQYLIINVNQLSGPLPAVDNGFPALRALNVSSNSFSGPIPVQLNSSSLFGQNSLLQSNGQPVQQVFDVSYNQLNGTLPSFMGQGKLPSWVTGGLYLQNNYFNVSCSDSTFNYITSICPNGASSTSNNQNTSPPTATKTSPSSPTDTTTSVQTSSSKQRDRSSGLDGGAIAGIVIGAVVGLLIIIAAAFLGVLLYRRRQEGVGLGEIGRSISLNRGLTSKGSANSEAAVNNNKFERFEDEGQKTIELSPSKEFAKP